MSTDHTVFDNDLFGLKHDSGAFFLSHLASFEERTLLIAGYGSPFPSQAIHLYLSCEDEDPAFVCVNYTGDTIVSSLRSTMVFDYQISGSHFDQVRPWHMAPEFSKYLQSLGFNVPDGTNRNFLFAPQLKDLKLPSP